MLYIDIDGVLADSDGYLATLEPRIVSDTHLLFKTLANNSETVFLESKPLVDLSFIKTLDEFTLLTALPNRANIASFHDSDSTVEKVFSNYVSNKRAWVKKYIGECELIITESAADKADHCKSSKDILIDDSDKNRKKWVAKGGIAFKSVEDYLRNFNPSAFGKPILTKNELW